jgi:hypothetical protein
MSEALRFAGYGIIGDMKDMTAIGNLSVSSLKSFVVVTCNSGT